MKKIFYITLVILLSVIATPVLAAGAKVTTFKELINTVFISGLIKPLVPFLIGFAVLMFIYGVLTLIFSEGGEKKEDGKKFMFWGIIGIFMMVSVWGLVNILVGVFNLDTTSQPINIEVPDVNINIPGL